MQGMCYDAVERDSFTMRARVKERESGRVKELPPIFSPTTRVGLAPLVTGESNDSAPPSSKRGGVGCFDTAEAAASQNTQMQRPSGQLVQLIAYSTRAKKAVLQRSSPFQIEKNNQTENLAETHSTFLYQRQQCRPNESVNSFAELRTFPKPFLKWDKCCPPESWRTRLAASAFTSTLRPLRQLPPSGLLKPLTSPSQPSSVVAAATANRHRITSSTSNRHHPNQPTANPFSVSVSFDFRRKYSDSFCSLGLVPKSKC